MTLLIFCFFSVFSSFTVRTSGTYCLLRSGRWPPCPLSSPLGWPVTDGHGCRGTVADHAVWSVRCCALLPDIHAQWCYGLRRLPPWCSGSTGTLSRCGSVSHWTPNSPTAGTTVWTGYLWLWGPAMRAWVLWGREINGIKQLSDKEIEEKKTRLWEKSLIPLEIVIPAHLTKLFQIQSFIPSMIQSHPCSAFNNVGDIRPLRWRKYLNDT